MHMTNQPVEHELYDIYMQWHQPFWQTDKFYIALGIVFFCFFCFVLWKVIAYCKNRHVVIPYSKGVYADLQELKKVEKADFFYTELVKIIKKYMSFHYHYDFSSKTDDEFMKKLNEMPDAQQIKDHVFALIAQTVTIRFARGQREKKIMQDDLQSAYQLVSLMQSKKSDSIQR